MSPVIQSVLDQLDLAQKGKLREYFRYPYKDFILPNDLGTIKTVVEGQRDDSNIFNIISYNDVLYRLDGQYDSWNGTEWDDEVYEVEAKEVAVTIYPRKK